VTSLIFSGMSGSAVADAAGIGRIIIDMMRKMAMQQPLPPPQQPLARSSRHPYQWFFMR